MSANLLGKFWVILNQALSVPILLSVWGPRDYGIWSMLFVLPSYVSLSDFGFGSAASVLMTQMTARNDQRGALVVFQSVGALVGLILLCVVGVSLAGWSLLPWLGRVFGFAPPQASLAWAFFLLLFYAVTWVAMTVVQVGYRSTKRYARGTVLLDLAMPLETGLMLAAAVMTHGFVACAAALFGVRLVAALLYYFRLRRDEPWLRFGREGVSWPMMRSLLKPALANFALPLGLTMSVQGVVFSIGLVAGPAIAGVFAATRTITRVPLQLTGVITRASQPELTIAHSLNDRPLLAKITSLNIAVTVATLAPFLLVSPWGSELLPIVSRGRVHVNGAFFIALECVACLQAFWSTFAMFIFAENRLQKLAPWCLAAGFAEIAIPFLLGPHASMAEFAAALCAVEGVVLVAAAGIWWRHSPLDVTDFRKASRGWLETAARVPMLASRKQAP